MLNHITTETIHAIIHLSDLAAEAADQLASGMVRSDAGRQSRGGEQGESDMSDMEPLRGSSMAAALEQLEAAIGELSPEARSELHAVYLIGRGEFTSREWDEALEAAGTRADESEPRMLAKRSGLGPRLAKGLYLLKLS